MSKTTGVKGVPTAACGHAETHVGFLIVEPDGSIRVVRTYKQTDCQRVEDLVGGRFTLRPLSAELDMWLPEGGGAWNPAATTVLDHFHGHGKFHAYGRAVVAGVSGRVTIPLRLEQLASVSAVAQAADLTRPEPDASEVREVIVVNVPGISQTVMARLW